MIRRLINWLNGRSERRDGIRILSNGSRLVGLGTTPQRAIDEWRRPWDVQSDRERGIALISSFLARNERTWAAAEPGECCTCGHDWIKGEMIGLVTQAFEVDRSTGRVWRAPGTRLACCVCVERQAIEGDLSLTWGREAGLL